MTPPKNKEKAKAVKIQENLSKLKHAKAGFSNIGKTRA